VRKFEGRKGRRFCDRLRAKLGLVTQMSTVKATTSPTPVSQLIAKRNTHTDHILGDR